MVADEVVPLTVDSPYAACGFPLGKVKLAAEHGNAIAHWRDKPNSQRGLLGQNEAGAAPEDHAFAVNPQR